LNIAREREREREGEEGGGGENYRRENKYTSNLSIILLKKVLAKDEEE